MKSKTFITKQTKRKTNSELVETIFLAKKNPAWLKVAGLLSGPRKRRKNINLSELDEKSLAGEKIVLVGKVLSQGEISKKIKIVALGFSETARQKLLNSKCEPSTLLEEINKNPKAEGVKILE